MMSTQTVGNSPLALSPDNMTQSAPSRMALATSLASARVGRDFFVMLSNICNSATLNLTISGRSRRSLSKGHILPVPFSPTLRFLPIFPALPSLSSIPSFPCHEAVSLIHVEGGSGSALATGVRESALHICIFDAFCSGTLSHLRSIYQHIVIHYRWPAYLTVYS